VTGSGGRRSIFVLIGNRTDLSKGGGDVFNEIKLYRRLSSVFDVYYNGQLIRWDEPGLGVSPSPLKVTHDYDYYYIRNNPKVASDVRGQLLLMAYPYEPKLWRKASGLIVTTQAWRRMLESFKSQRVPAQLREPWYPRRIVDPPPIILAEQSVSADFEPMQSDVRTKIYRAKFGLGFRAGFIGRMDPTCFPLDAIKAIHRLRREFPELSLTFVGPHRDIEVPDWIPTWPPQPHEEMPYVTSSFDCLLYDQDETGNWLGSAKVLEAMACGVPILVRLHEARVEQLGRDYPLYYTNSAELEEKLRRLIVDDEFRLHVHRLLLHRALHYAHDPVTLRLHEELHRWLPGSVPAIGLTRP
jgi:glycosyltransferase involved in cell wall biosynthesis